MIIIVELDLPVLGLNIPTYVLSKKLNLDEDIYLNYLYSNNTYDESYFYTGAFVYNDDVVASVIF